MANRPLVRPADLARMGLIGHDEVAALDGVADRYAVAITPLMARLIDRSDPADPLARQFVPSRQELTDMPAERPDPIGDDAHSPVEGVVHRYPDRVLLKLVHVCAVYCRFCFRREMVGPGKRPALTPSAVAGALDYVAANAAIWEVILSGGDPLLLSPRRLRTVAERLAGIDHVKILRVHTRIPAVAPELVTKALIEALKAAGKATYVVLHANHPRELTSEARAACAEIVDAGIPMLSQSVLLRGVNDAPDTLEALLRAFVECRIKPYYLHHGDLAPGTGHLRTSIALGQHLVSGLRGRVSGLCQPDYVLDVPGGYGKSPLAPAFCKEHSEKPGGAREYLVTDFTGREHTYIDRIVDKAPDTQQTRAVKRSRTP